MEILDKKDNFGKTSNWKNILILNKKQGKEILKIFNIENLFKKKILEEY